MKIIKLFYILFLCVFSKLLFAQTYTAYYPEIVYFKSNWCPSAYDLENLRRSAPNLYFKSLIHPISISNKLSCCVDRVILPDGETRQRIAERFPEGVADREDTADCSGKIPTEEEALKLLSGEITYVKLREQQSIFLNSVSNLNIKNNVPNYDKNKETHHYGQKSLKNNSSDGFCYTGPRGGTYTITSGGRKNYNGC